MSPRVQLEITPDEHGHVFPTPPEAWNIKQAVETFKEAVDRRLLVPSAFKLWPR